MLLDKTLRNVVENTCHSLLYSMLAIETPKTNAQLPNKPPVYNPR